MIELSHLFQLPPDRLLDNREGDLTCILATRLLSGLPHGLFFSFLHVFETDKTRTRCQRLGISNFTTTKFRVDLDLQPTRFAQLQKKVLKRQVGVGGLGHDQLA